MRSMMASMMQFMMESIGGAEGGSHGAGIRRRFRLIRGAGLVCALALTFLTPGGGGAQAGPASTRVPAAIQQGQSKRDAEDRVLPAVRVQGSEPRIDGRLDDDAWALAPVATDFVQLEPDEGSAATERTEVRVLYGEDALFVAFHAYDRSAQEILGPLIRRDQYSFSDRVIVVIDSHAGQRTALQFAVNSRGMKQDSYRFDDTREDTGWDVVWDVATSVQSGVWTAEFKIPYSQPRFGDAAVQDWGINFLREIARKNERAFWSPVSGQDDAYVSKFGTPEGLRDLDLDLDLPDPVRPSCRPCSVRMP